MSEQKDESTRVGFDAIDGNVPVTDNESSVHETDAIEVTDRVKDMLVNASPAMTSQHTRQNDKQENAEEQQLEGFGNFSAYMAFCKGYCAINILVLPIQVSNGGWAMGLVCLTVGSFLVTVCAVKLVRAGRKTNRYAYQDIVKDALGESVFRVILGILAFVQFSFTITQITFTIKSVREVLSADHVFGVHKETNLWYFAIPLIVCYSPLAWVRNLEYFKIGYIIGTFMIVWTVLVVSGYCIVGLINDGPRQPGSFYAVNENASEIWDMVGFAFYTFEGIGTVMPIIEKTNKDVNVEGVLKFALGSLWLMFTGFGLLCFYYFGPMAEDKSFVIENLDPNDKFVQLTKLLFCVNLVYSYPLSIFPTNQILERLLFTCMEESRTKYWVVNLNRTFVIFLACFLSITFADTLDHFLGVTGAAFGIPLILMAPTMCDYVIVSVKKSDKILNLVIILLAAGILVIATFKSVQNWVDADS